MRPNVRNRARSERLVELLPAFIRSIAMAHKVGKLVDVPALTIGDSFNHYVVGPDTVNGSSSMGSTDTRTFIARSGDQVWYLNSTRRAHCT